MDASLSDEQQILRDTVAQLAADLAPESPAELPAEGSGESGWAQLAEMGLLGMRLPESAGGMPASGVEVALTAEELGKRVVPLPFIGSAVYSSSLLSAAQASADLLASLCDGSRRLAPVFDPTLTRPAFLGETWLPGVFIESLFDVCSAAQTWISNYSRSPMGYAIMVVILAVGEGAEGSVQVLDQCRRSWCPAH